jgi:surface protein
VSSDTVMHHMFRGAIDFDQPLDSLDVSNVNNMGSMFKNADSFNQPLNMWDVSKVTDMQEMFNGAIAFNQSLGTWNISSATNMANMLNSVGMDCIKYDSTLVGWEAQGVTGLSLGATGLTYDIGLIAHTALTSTHGWTITGDSHVPGCNTVCVVVTTPAEVTNTWIGCNSSDWSDAANWSTNTIPVATDIVYIPIAAVNELIIDQTVTCAKMIVQIGAKCKVNYNAGGKLLIKF